MGPLALRRRVPVGNVSMNDERGSLEDNAIMGEGRMEGRKATSRV